LNFTVVDRRKVRLKQCSVIFRNDFLLVWVPNLFVGGILIPRSRHSSGITVEHWLM